MPPLNKLRETDQSRHVTEISIETVPEALEHPAFVSLEASRGYIQKRSGPIPSIRAGLWMPAEPNQSADRALISRFVPRRAKPPCLDLLPRLVVSSLRQ